MEFYFYQIPSNSHQWKSCNQTHPTGIHFELNCVGLRHAIVQIIVLQTEFRNINFEMIQWALFKIIEAKGGQLVKR